MDDVKSKENENTGIDYSSNPKGSKIEGVPEYITQLSDNEYKVTYKSEYFIFTDLKYKVIKELAERSKDSRGQVKESVLTDMILIKSIVYPKITAQDLDDFTGSKVFRLRQAIAYIYDVDSFLQ